MANEISFYEPLDPSVPISFDGNAARFEAQFKVVPAPGGGAALLIPIPTPSTPILLAAALDIGYGAAAAQLCMFNPSEWVGLRQHLKHRLDLVQSILLQNPVMDWVLAPFSEHLEQNEKSGSAYALGMLYCRVATGEFAAKNAWGPPQRFWHYKVAQDSAVCLTALKNPALSEKMNPDFLVQFGPQTWAGVEAKGSLSGLSWPKLKEGLAQASKFNSIRFFDFAAGNFIVRPVTVKACTLTYFQDATKTLEILHLDPPEVQISDEDNLGTKEPVYILEAGDLLRFAQAIRQHSLFDEAPLSENPEGIVPGSYHWSSWPGDAKVLIGLPCVLRTNQAKLFWSIQALRRLMPVIARWRDRRESDSTGAPNELLALAASILNERRDPLESAASVSAWRQIAEYLGALADTDKEPTWSSVLADLWQIPILEHFNIEPRASNVTSFFELWDHLGAVIESVQEQWRLRSVYAGERGSIGVPTSHGLLVIGRGAK